MCDGFEGVNTGVVGLKPLRGMVACLCYGAMLFPLQVEALRLSIATYSESCKMLLRIYNSIIFTPSKRNGQNNEIRGSIVILVFLMIVPAIKFDSSCHIRISSPFTARLQVTCRALLALLRREFWVVFCRLNSAVRAAALHDFAVTRKHLVW
jgi:hypothetical protein